MKLDYAQRRAGMFVPLFAIRSSQDLGVGDTRSLKEMIDWCQKNSLSILQILPINVTSGDNSPYNAISSVALEPSTASCLPEDLPGLKKKDYEKLVDEKTLQKLNEGPVNYEKVNQIKHDLFWKAFKNFVKDGKPEHKNEYTAFCKNEKTWLNDYALFRALKEINDLSPVWESWPEEHRSPALASKWVKSLSKKKSEAFCERIEFFKYVQWVLYKQWEDCSEYAQKCGVYLMGDIPFGLSRHSADVWANPEDFDLEWCGGAPPEPLFKHDKFTELWGQNWGIPLYRWDVMKENGYRWWKQRVGMTARIFHLFRIDHILGFYRIYSFPWQPQDNHLYTELTEEEVEAKLGKLPQFLPHSDETEEGAKENQEHGEELLKMILEAAGKTTVIGEDLGVVPKYVRPSLQKLKISGFKIPIFERHPSHREYTDPETFPELTLATLSTHDHESMCGFWDNWWAHYDTRDDLLYQGKTDNDEEVKEATYASWELYRTLRFAELDDRELIRDFNPTVREGVCERLLKSKSWLAILMVTDIFGIKTRFNVPGPVADSNWSERLPYTMKELSEKPDLVAITDFLSRAIEETGRKVG